MYYKTILTFLFKFCILGFFTSWIRIREAYLYADPKHCYSEYLYVSGSNRHRE